MEYWQDFARAGPPPGRDVWTESYAATMPDGSRLVLPLRDLGERAVAGLIVNQAAFVVLDRLTAWLAEVARVHRPDTVVGLPTLGHVVGAGVARALGHTNWVAPGMTRKLWYETSLSVPISSVTSPEAGRRLWLDPRLLPRLAGRRVLIVDDVVSTGASLLAGLELLRLAGITPVAACVCMIQGDRWVTTIPPDLALRGVFATPVLRGVIGGWTPIPGTARDDLCPLLAARCG